MQTQSGLMRLQWLWCSALVIIFDQLSKAWAVHALSYKILKVLPFLNFRLAFNRGAAFSFLGDAGGWQVVFFAVLALLICGVLCIWLTRLGAHKIMQACALSLIIGGALGNVIDRVRLGYVIDFIDFHIQHWHYATFNLADTAICIGAVILILSSLFGTKES